MYQQKLLLIWASKGATVQFEYPGPAHRLHIGLSLVGRKAGHSLGTPFDLAWSEEGDLGNAYVNKFQGVNVCKRHYVIQEETEEMLRCCKVLEMIRRARQLSYNTFFVASRKPRSQRKETKCRKC